MAVEKERDSYILRLLRPYGNQTLHVIQCIYAYLLLSEVMTITIFLLVYFQVTSCGNFKTRSYLKVDITEGSTT
jgi:hypothetical protein